MRKSILKTNSHAAKTNKKEKVIALHTDRSLAPSKVKYITKTERLEQLSSQQQDELKKVAERFEFRSNDYYLSLINWLDPDDPIRRIIVPHTDELDEWGMLDPSDEKTYTIMPGLEHKYRSTALLLVSNVCDGVCRYCFRKRVFIEPQKEYLQDIPAAIQYIKAHHEITNVLLTGGDPLLLTTAKLDNIIGQLRQIDHVHLIRIGTKTPAFNPHRIINDPALLEMLSSYSTEQKKIYIMTHFVHPRELTDSAVKAVDFLQRAGAKIANQMPLIKGVNDNPEVLAGLLSKLSFIGAIPYYVFQCRPAIGNRSYTIPIEQGYEIIEQAKSLVSGLAKRVRFVMSHSSGKVEIVARTHKYIYLKYHRAACDQDNGRVMIFKRNPNACWLDDYDQAVQDSPIN